VTARDEVVFHGGLMRCCLETLDERTEPAKDGDRQPCKYCTSAAVFTEERLDSMPHARGSWRWEGAKSS
jgi:hypothetical protein